MSGRLVLFLIFSAMMIWKTLNLLVKVARYTVVIYVLQHQHGAYLGSNSDTNWLFMFRQEKSKELLESSKVGYCLS